MKKLVALLAMASVFAVHSTASPKAALLELDFYCSQGTNVPLVDPYCVTNVWPSGWTEEQIKDDIQDRWRDLYMAATTCNADICDAPKTCSKYAFWNDGGVFVTTSGAKTTVCYTNANVDVGCTDCD